MYKFAFQVNFHLVVMVLLYLHVKKTPIYIWCRLKWHDCSRYSCIRGSWWCCYRTCLWACAMAMLMVIGELKQCCPLLTDCIVQKRGDNSLKKSGATVCGNTPYTTTRTSSPSWWCVLQSSLSFFCAHCDPGMCHVAGVGNVTLAALQLC